MMDPDLKTKYERYILIGITLFGFLLLYMSLRSENILVLGLSIIIIVVMGMVWLFRFIFWWDEQ